MTDTDTAPAPANGRPPGSEPRIPAQARAGSRTASAHRRTDLEPPFPVGGPADQSWRESALTRIAEMRALAAWLVAESEDPRSGGLLAAIDEHLAEAQAAAEGGSRRRAVNGSNVERALSHLDAAEADILRLAPAAYVSGQLPSLLAHVRQNLPATDPRRVRLERIAGRDATEPLDDLERSAVIAAVRGASAEARRKDARVCSFRNLLLATAALLSVAAVGVAVLAALHPEAIPLCFRPEGKIVCPTAELAVSGAQAPAGASADVVGAQQAIVSSWDVPLVEMLGLVAAAVAAAAALRGVRGTSTPYGVPIALAVLKLPTGALTAVLGILLMRGAFVPGLSALDFSAQILAWAIVFGYAQQLLTRFVDQQGQSVLESVGGPGRDASA